MVAITHITLKLTLIEIFAVHEALGNMGVSGYSSPELRAAGQLVFNELTRITDAADG